MLFLRTTTQFPNIVSIYGHLSLRFCSFFDSGHNTAPGSEGQLVRTGDKNDYLLKYFSIDVDKLGHSALQSCSIKLFDKREHSKTVALGYLANLQSGWIWWELKGSLFW